MTLQEIDFQTFRADERYHAVGKGLLTLEGKQPWRIAALNRAHVEIGHLRHRHKLRTTIVVQDEDILGNTELVLLLQFPCSGEIASGIDIFDFDLVSA